MGLEYYVKRKTLYLKGNLIAEEIKKNKFNFFAVLYGEYFASIDISSLSLVDFSGVDLLKDIIHKAPQMEFYKNKTKIQLAKADEIINHIHLHIKYDSEKESKSKSALSSSSITSINSGIQKETLYSGLKNVTRKKIKKTPPPPAVVPLQPKNRQITTETTVPDRLELLEKQYQEQLKEIERLKTLLTQKEQKQKASSQSYIDTDFHYKTSLHQNTEKKENISDKKPEMGIQSESNNPSPVIIQEKQKDIKLEEKKPIPEFIPPEGKDVKPDSISATLFPEQSSEKKVSVPEKDTVEEPPKKIREEIKTIASETITKRTVSAPEVNPPITLEKPEPMISEPVVIKTKAVLPLEEIRAKAAAIKRERLYLSEIGLSQKDYNRHPMEVVDELEDIILSRNPYQFRIFSLRLFQYLFCPPLETPQYEDNGENIFFTQYALFANYSNTGFWNRLVSLTGNASICADTLYKGDITPEDAAEFLLYLMKSPENSVGILIHSGKAEPLTIEYLKQEWEENGILVLLLNMSDIHEMLSLKSGNLSPEKVLLDRLQEQFDINLS